MLTDIKYSINKFALDTCIIIDKYYLLLTIT